MERDLPSRWLVSIGADDADHLGSRRTEIGCSKMNNGRTDGAIGFDQLKLGFNAAGTCRDHGAGECACGGVENEATGGKI